MANPFDVASRLAEGRPAVDDVAEYVAACHRLGYQHPDLTAYATQVHAWYASEEGMDLRALDADCAVLSAVAAAAGDAARTQNGLVAELSGAWSGRGAGAAREFTWRSGQAAHDVGEAIRVAADAALTLRDALWHAVDAKVAAVVAIDGRHQAQRAQWLPAAESVTNGGGDLAAASELIDQQVKPFVENDVGSDWLGAMRTANTSITGAYGAALATTTAAPRATFDVPGELGPRAERPENAVTKSFSNPSPRVQTVPAAAPSSAAAPPAAAMMASPPGPPAAPWPATAPAVAPPFADLAAQTPAPSMPAGAPSTPGGLGEGTSSLGTGLSGFGQQLADLIGGLVGSADGGSPDAADVGHLDDADETDEPPNDAKGEDPDDKDNAEDEDPELDEPNDPDAADESEDPAAETEAKAQAVDCDVEATGEPTPEAAAVEPQPNPPPPPQVIPEAVAQNAEPTPCEIAADELPQVGE